MWLAGCPAIAQAATLVVDAGGGGAYDTLADAIEASGAGDRIELRPGTYDETVTVDHVVTIVGEPGVVLRGAGDDFLIVDAGAYVVLSGLTFQGLPEEHARAIHVRDGAVNASSCTFTGHDVDGDGGAVLMDNRPTNELEFVDVTMTGNAATGDGGHLAAMGGTVELVWSTLTLGLATSGAGLFMGGGFLTVRGARIEGNVAAEYGGGIYAEDTAATVLDTIVADNTAAAFDGGGIYQAGTTPSGNYTGVLFCDNGAGRRGGGAMVRQTAVFDHVAFVRNHGGTDAGEGGGALRIEPGTTSVTFATFVGNDTLRGQAVGSAADGSTVSNSVFAEHVQMTDHFLFYASASDGLTVRESVVDNLNHLQDGSLVDLQNLSLVADPFPDVPAGCDGGALVPTDPGVLAAGLGAVTDADEDGHYTLSDDCDDANADVFAGATEDVADDLDSDCDGFELCYADLDGDGYFEAQNTVPSRSLSCDGPGVSDTPNDDCPLVAGDYDGCPCTPTDPDSDGDGVCDRADQCPGSPDSDDVDGDGYPDDCDSCREVFGIDTDGDGVCDLDDTCPYDPSPACGVRDMGADVTLPPPRVGCGCGGSDRGLGAGVVVVGGLIVQARRRKRAAR